MLNALCMKIHKDLPDICAQREIKPNSIFCAFFGVLLIVMQLDTEHLVLVLVGATAYLLLQLCPQKQVTPSSKKASWEAAALSQSQFTSHCQQSNPRGQNQQTSASVRRPPAGPPRTTLKEYGMKSHGAPTATPSVVPLAAPVFISTGFEPEVNELLTQLMPSQDSEAMLERITKLAQQAVQSFVPEAEVLGFSPGSINRGTCFGVAVPDVQILVRCHNDVLMQRLAARLSKGHSRQTSTSTPNLSGSTSMIDGRKLQKSAIRSFTDVLVAAGFKFRRSAFRDAEPKVTLLAPPLEGICDDALPIDFAVNITTPLYNAALLSSAKALDQRVLELGLLVKRWAKDRGVCHAAKGHMPPYAWTVMVIFFLQAGKERTKPMLPHMKLFDWSSCPEGTKPVRVPEAAGERWVVPEVNASCKAPQLLREFFHFYSSEIDWTKEAVSVRRGHRGPPPSTLDCFFLDPDVLDAPGTSVPMGKHKTPLPIENPFEPSKNMACCLSLFGHSRMDEELARAERICSSSNASLSELLEPWVPPEQPAHAGDSDDEKKPRGRTAATAAPLPRGLADLGSLPDKVTVKTANATTPAQDIGEAIFARLRAHGEEQARRATAELLDELRNVDSSAKEEKKQSIEALLHDEGRLSEILSRNRAPKGV